jgi:antitoxin (DNA-binding transcriptional repressor) of toxin-antitoxin stability system
MHAWSNFSGPVPGEFHALPARFCDAKMHHMKQASVRDLRYRFSEVERLLVRGEKIEITKRKQIIAHLLPARSTVGRRPDFLARLRSIYGDKILEVSGAQLLAQERDRN